MLVIYISPWPLVVCPVRVSSDDVFDPSWRRSYANLRCLARAEVCRKLEASASARNETSSVTGTEDFGQVCTITPALDRPSLATSRNQTAKGHEPDGGIIVMGGQKRCGFRPVP